MCANDTKDELFHEFIEESEEMVSMVERSSSALEANPSRIDAVHEIFRGVHSLKGNSTFFNLQNLKTFCHEFESFLELVRSKSIEVTPDIVHFILDGVDLLKSIFHRMRDSGADVELRQDELKYLEALDDKSTQNSEEARKDSLRIELVRFFAKAKEEGQMDEDSPVKELYDIIGKLSPELTHDKRKGASGNGARWFFGDMDVSREYSALRAMVQEIQAGGVVDNAPKVFSANMESLVARHEKAKNTDQVELLNNLKENFDIFYQDEIGVDEMLAGTISESLDEYAKLLTEVKPEVKEEKKAVKKTKSDSKESAASREPAARSKTVRIRENLLDTFMDQVGELVTMNELFNIIQRKLEDGEADGLSLDLKNTNQAFRELSGQMQKSLYEIRKAPLDRALSKLPSIIRNMSKTFGKVIRVVMSGGETEVDKSLLDKIETMLIHCVRNSADHGLETPSERKAKGKDVEGTITIAVTSDKSRIFIAIEDDGRGVDIERVKKKAVERGLHSLDSVSKMTSQEALNILMTPGFSTAEKVTETSGRGVGMDVLWASVYEMGGEIRLTNNPGAGFRIDIALPQATTTRIKLGLTLGVGGSAFLVPAENVRESFRASPNDVQTIEGRGEVVKRWGKIYPAVRLSDLFNITPAHQNIWDAICVIAEAKGSTICLVVDEMVGQRQIVYKELTVQTREPCAFEGVSILDGRHMALILSVEGIIKQFQQ